ncbi:TniQ family protein [Streptomyces sp. NL15-2K]|uniref:TniQ family protein n=1 Tax=Streptomyces sp. NL15-2K TaxID=376149 RepID=UPI000FF9EDEA|nr:MULTISPECIES: TniQ family protein [Actinomycetes]WKX08075.1 TniQ family protein [Kutzneria buriramensis]WKX10021.1 TniQ family protein [Kutzneria buriramensis]WKX11650.1 TniQ family protein [Kutzneria buriramensis]WKX12437.1 TniQ family protein [Kutzneria buriramensis]WKX15834.1 TniQ family protein [Kutzneria buriramensis]
MHRETVGSYLNRLADANRLPVRYLAGLLGHNRHHRRDDNRTDHWTPRALLGLSALTGRAPAELVHAMPALAELSEGQRIGPRPSTGHGDALHRPACRPCMARRGIDGLVVRETLPHEAVCPRHHRWLLGDEQHLLRVLPDVRRANQRHRRLTSRRRGSAPEQSYRTARDSLLKWFHTAAETQLQQRWTDRIHLLGEDIYGDPLRPSPNRIEIATYPETVILTSLLSSPHWRDHQESAPEIARRFQLKAGSRELAALQKLATSLRPRLSLSQSD